MSEKLVSVCILKKKIRNTQPKQKSKCNLLKVFNCFPEELKHNSIKLQLACKQMLRGKVARIQSKGGQAAAGTQVTLNMET